MASSEVSFLRVKCYGVIFDAHKFALRPKRLPEADDPIKSCSESVLAPVTCMSLAASYR